MALSLHHARDITVWHGPMSRDIRIAKNTQYLSNTLFLLILNGKFNYWQSGLFHTGLPCGSGRG